MNTTVATANSDNFKDKLRKLLALSKDKANEHEAALAAERLHDLLAKYNLDIADLEAAGKRVKSQVGEQKGPSLGKAAWKWKYQLASMLADHYFCVSLADYDRKSDIAFVGRPENVEALTMLYEWLLTQIHQIGTVERRNHHVRTGEHIDPLRWQLNFGLGAVGRLRERLDEQRQRQSSDVTALVVHHKAEISDYLEEKHGYRVDGQHTKRYREYLERVNKETKAKEDFRAVCEAAGDLEPFYRAYPFDRPIVETAAEKLAREKRERAAAEKWERKWKREDEAAERRADREAADPELRRRKQQGQSANASGRTAADKINLQPFIEGKKGDSGKLR